GLSGLVAVVDDEAEPVLHEPELIGHATRREHDLTHRLDVLRLEVVDGRDVLLRNDEHVGRRDRPDVLERERVVVLVDDRGRDLLLEDVAEQAAHGQRAYAASGSISASASGLPGPAAPPRGGRQPAAALGAALARATM